VTHTHTHTQTRTQSHILTRIHIHLGAWIWPFPHGQRAGAIANLRRLSSGAHFTWRPLGSVSWSKGFPPFGATLVAWDLKANATNHERVRVRVEFSSREEVGKTEELLFHNNKSPTYCRAEAARERESGPGEPATSSRQVANVWPITLARLCVQWAANCVRFCRAREEPRCSEKLQVEHTSRIVLCAGWRK